MEGEGMTVSFDRAAAMAKMPRCGSCVNAKLIVWTGEVELKTSASRYVFKPMGPGKTPQVTVVCGWLKRQIEAPDTLVICDGWRQAGDDLQPRDGV
jgi:hypothetical protein